MVYFVFLLILGTILPFGITTSQDKLVQTLVQWVPKEFGFFIGASLMIAMSIFQDRERVNTFNNKWIAVFLVYAVIHFAWIFYRPILAINPQGMYTIAHGAVRPFLNIFLGIILIKILVENLSVGDWVKITKFLCWAGFLLSVYSILQWFKIDQIFLREGWSLNHSNNMAVRKDYMMTFLSNHILSSNYIALIAPLCLMFKDFRYKLFLLIMTISVCMADSLVSFGALVVSILAYLLFCGRSRVLFLSIIFFVLLAVFMAGKHQNYFSTNGRMPLWEQTISDTLKNNPFTGIGIGNYAKKYKSGNEMVLSAHNEFVQSFSEGGIQLFLIVIGYLVTLSKRLLLIIFEKKFIMTICFFSAFLGFLVVCNGSSPFRFAPLAVLGILYIANLESMLGDPNV